VKAIIYITADPSVHAKDRAVFYSERRSSPIAFTNNNLFYLEENT
jgi:hypothetical protein